MQKTKSERPHAVLAPSAAAEWLNCPANARARLLGRFPKDKSSPAAEDGTRKHKLVENFLLNWLQIRENDSGQVSMRRMQNSLLELSLAERAAIIQTTLTHLPLGVLFEVEKKLKIAFPLLRNGKMSAGNTFGTADIVAYNPKTEIATLIDWKFGFHDVPPYSEQMRLYAAGVLQLSGDGFCIAANASPEELRAALRAICAENGLPSDCKPELRGEYSEFYAQNNNNTRGVLLDGGIEGRGVFRENDWFHKIHEIPAVPPEGLCFQWNEKASLCAAFIAAAFRTKSRAANIGDLDISPKLLREAWESGDLAAFEKLRCSRNQLLRTLNGRVFPWFRESGYDCGRISARDAHNYLERPLTQPPQGCISGAALMLAKIHPKYGARQLIELGLYHGFRPIILNSKDARLQVEFYLERAKAQGGEWPARFEKLTPMTVFWAANRLADKDDPDIERYESLAAQADIWAVPAQSWRPGFKAEGKASLAEILAGRRVIGGGGVFEIEGREDIAEMSCGKDWGKRGLEILHKDGKEPRFKAGEIDFAAIPADVRDEWLLVRPFAWKYEEKTANNGEILPNIGKKPPLAGIILPKTNLTSRNLVAYIRAISDFIPEGESEAETLSWRERLAENEKKTQRGRIRAFEEVLNRAMNAETDLEASAEAAQSDLTDGGTGRRRETKWLSAGVYSAVNSPRSLDADYARWEDKAFAALNGEMKGLAYDEVLSRLKESGLDFQFLRRLFAEIGARAQFMPNTGISVIIPAKTVGRAFCEAAAARWSFPLEREEKRCRKGEAVGKASLKRRDALKCAAERVMGGESVKSAAVFLGLNYKTLRRFLKKS